MTGGAIDGNEGTYFAGGVMVSGNAKFNMNMALFKQHQCYMRVVFGQD